MLTVFNKKIDVLDIVRRTLLTLIFPAILFFTMWIICAANGKGNIYIHEYLGKYLIRDGCITTIIALAIFSQFRSGRFDFSGGATMILAAILGGNIALTFAPNGDTAGGMVAFIFFTILFAVILSLVTGFVYIVTRVPIIIITIAITLVYEAITYLVFGAKTLSIISMPMASIGKDPYILISMIVAVLVFVIYTYFTKAGKESQLLARNQKVAVSSGINEKKNIMCTYVITGILLGLGGIAYASQNQVAPQSSLSTSGILFSYVVPVYVGLFIGSASVDVVGVVVVGFSLSFMNYGLEVMGVGAGGINQIIQGLFMMGVYAIASQMDKIKRFINFVKGKFTRVEQNA